MEAVTQSEYDDIISQLTENPGSFNTMQAQFLLEKVGYSRDILDSHLEETQVTLINRCFEKARYDAWHSTRPKLGPEYQSNDKSRLGIYAAVKRLFLHKRIVFRFADSGRVRLLGSQGLGCLSKDKILGEFIQAPLRVCQVIIGPMKVFENISLINDQNLPIQLYQEILAHGLITSLSLAYHVLGRETVMGISRTTRYRRLR